MLPNSLYVVLVIVILMPIILGTAVLIEFRRLRRRLNNRIDKLREELSALLQISINKAKSSPFTP